MSSKSRGLGDKFVTITIVIGAIASCLGIIAFCSGIQSLPQIVGLLGALGWRSVTPAPLDTPMIEIPGGEFIMGSADFDADASSDERPQHTVYLDAFWIDEFEVSNAEYRKCVNAGKCNPPAVVASSTRSYYLGNPEYDNYPVIWISWYDAKSFCEWIGGRLPSEAEWEKAARSNDGRTYPWGNKWDGTKLNYCDSNCPFIYRDTAFNDGYSDTAPVGTFVAGASPYGVKDMAGNVSEWVADWYSGSYYSVSPNDNPAGPTSGQGKIVRGGAWSISRAFLRVANRERTALPDERHEDIGFRCTRSNPPRAGFPSVNWPIWP